MCGAGALFVPSHSVATAFAQTITAAPIVAAPPQAKPAIPHDTKQSTLISTATSSLLVMRHHRGDLVNNCLTCRKKPASLLARWRIYATSDHPRRDHRRAP